MAGAGANMADTGAAGHHMERAHAGDIEIGVSDALQRHVTRHVIPPKPVSQRKLNFEHKRPRVLRECMAEATGVFFYVFPGIASVCTFTLNGASPLGVTAFGSIFQIGWVRIPIIKHLLVLNSLPGFCHRHRVRHHNVRANLWWPLQPRYNDLLCSLARLPLEEG